MIKIYLKDEEEERDFEIHVRLIIAVLFASKENVHYEWDFAIEKRILYQPNKSIEYIHLKIKLLLSYHEIVVVIHWVLNEIDQDHHSIEFFPLLQDHHQLTNHHFQKSSK